MTKFAQSLDRIVQIMVRNGMKTREAWAIVKAPGFRAKYLASLAETVPKAVKKVNPFFSSWDGRRYLANLNPEMDTDALMNIRGLADTSRRTVGDLGIN